MNNTTIQTVSSCEMAELTAKYHQDVLRDMVEMLYQFGEAPGKSAGYCIAPNGKQTPAAICQGARP